MEIIARNTSSDNEIFKWFCEVNNDFVPPLDSLVDLQVYAKKIFAHAQRFELLKDTELKGLLAAYFNEDKKMAFVTIFGIAREARTLGNIRLLFISFLKDFLKNPEMRYVELEVHHLNKSLLRFYNKLNFKIKETREHSYIFEASRSQCIFLSS